MRESVVHQVTAQSTGSSEADQGELRTSGRPPAVLARKRQPQHGSSETLAAALLICPRACLVMVVETLLGLTSTAAEYAITALRLDQRRHLRLAQPDSCSAPGYLDRRSMLATGRRVQDRRSRSHATPVGRPRRDGREWDNKSPRKTASRSTPVAYR